jgi:hypothetical protein
MAFTTMFFNYKYPSMHAHKPINPMVIHFLYCIYGNDHIGTHNVIQNTFIAIARNVGFHVGQK